MEKQKQIEDMAHIASTNCGECETCEFFLEKNGKIKCIDYLIATEIYNAGYRKIPSDAVVLTEREHEIAMIHQYDVGFGFGYKKGSKETAREILQAVDKESCGQTIAITNILRKRYGVEVEE